MEVFGVQGPHCYPGGALLEQNTVLCCSLSYSCSLMAADLRSHDATSAWGSGQKELRPLFLTWYCTFSPVPWSSFTWGSTCLATGPPMAPYQNVPLSSRYIPSCKESHLVLQSSRKMSLNCCFVSAGGSQLHIKQEGAIANYLIHLLTQIHSEGITGPQEVMLRL